MNTLSWLLSRAISYFLLETNEDDLDMLPNRMKQAAENIGSQKPFSTENNSLIDEDDLIDILVEYNGVPHMSVPLDPGIETEKVPENTSDDLVYKTLENSMAPKLKTMNIPSWGAFNSSISKDNVSTKTKKLYLPFVPAPASDYSAIYSALMIAQGITVHTREVDVL